MSWLLAWTCWRGTTAPRPRAIPRTRLAEGFRLTGSPGGRLRQSASFPRPCCLPCTHFCDEVSGALLVTLDLFASPDGKEGTLTLQVHSPGLFGQKVSQYVNGQQRMHRVLNGCPFAFWLKRSGPLSLLSSEVSSGVSCLFDGFRA